MKVAKKGDEKSKMTGSATKWKGDDGAAKRGEAKRVGQDEKIDLAGNED